MHQLGLTPQMKSVLDCIIRYTAARGYSPTFQEIADALGIRAKSAVHRRVHALKERGYIDLVPDKNRSIAVLTNVSEAFTLPPATLNKLHKFCLATGENPAAVVADAVLLHLDELALEAAA